MSIDQVTGSGIGIRPRQIGEGASTPTEGSGPQPEVARPDGSADSQRNSGVADSLALPREAPEGTDPALWEGLSSDERVFLAALGDARPVTYGRVAFGSSPSGSAKSSLSGSVGVRLDVKG